MAVETLNAHLNKELIQRVDVYVDSQKIKTIASRKQFIELAILEKLNALSGEKGES